MGYFQQASQYGARGGDAALARRAKQFAEMQAVARQQSLLGPDVESPEAAGFKGAFFRVVDVISRPNYAVAGFADTLAGNGKEGEYAMERAFREMFSGVAGLEGDKETFGDVLEQAGFGEGGKLSDLVGDNGLTRNFNPTTRDAVGVALDIFTDPLTYVSAPIKNASVVVGVGGEVRFLNKAGLAARIAGYNKKLEGWKKALSLSEDASDISVMRAIGESSEFAAQNTDTAAALAKSPSTQLVEVGLTLNREVGEELVASGNKALFESPGLRYKPLPGVDIPVGLDQALAKVSGFIWDGMKNTDLGAAAVDFAAPKLQALDQVFNQVPFLARKNTQYYRDRSEWFMRRTSAEHVADLEAKTVMAGIPMSQWDNRDLWRAFARAVERGADDPQAVETWAAAAKSHGIEAPEQFMDKWVKTFNRVGQAEVDAGFLNSSDFLAHEGRYFHRVVDHFDEATRKDLQQVSARRSGSAGVGDRSYRHQRLLETWDDFEANALAKGVKEEDLVLNPYEVAKNRLTGHYEDLVTKQFLERTQATMGFKNSTEFARLNERLQELGADALAKDEADFFAAVRERSSTFNPDGYKTARRIELARLLRETPEGEAFQRLDGIVEKLGEGLSEQKRRVLKAKVQKEYKQIRNARSRADIFDQNQFTKQAISEAKIDRSIRKDLRELQATLKAAGNRAMAKGAGGHRAELEAVLAREQEKLASFKQIKRDAPSTSGQKAAQQELRDTKAKISQLKKTLTKLSKTEGRLAKDVRLPSEVKFPLSAESAFFDRMTDLDDALRRADDLGDVIAARKGLAAEMRDEAEGLIAVQVEQIKAVRSGIKEFVETFKKDLVRDFDGNTVRSLQDEMNLIQKNLDEIAARRKKITARKEAARDEIRKTDEVFQDLESSLATMTDEAAYTRKSLSAAKAARAEAKAEFGAVNPTTVKELNAADMAKFRSLRPEARAAYFHEAISEIDDIQHFEGFINKWGDEIAAVDEEMAQLSDQIVGGKLYDQYGQEYTKISVRTGPRAKDTSALDREIERSAGEKAALKGQQKDAREALSAAESNFKAAKAAGVTDDELEVFKLERSVAQRRLSEIKQMRKAEGEAHRVAMKQRSAIPSSGGSKQLYVPKGVADDFKNIENIFLQNEEVSQLLHVYDKLSNWFKLSVTRYFPAFHVRNAYSNVAASFLDIGMEALNANRSRQALDILRGADGTLQVGNKSVPFEVIRQELGVLGIRVDKAMIAELTGTKQTAFDPLEKLIAQGLKKDSITEKAAGVATKAYSIPGNVENHARAMHYLALRRRGFTPQDAGFQVNKFLFDYADLSPTERAVFRRLFPFWTWTRKNAERQIKNLYENPGRLATQIKLATEDRGPSGDLLPEYMRGQMSVKVRNDEKGESWLTGIDLPIANMNILWAGGFGKTFREQIGLLTPILKTPIEVGTGQDFFTGQSIHGVGGIREKLGSSMDRNLPKVLKQYFELENIGTEDSPRWQANRLKLHIATKAMFISRFVSSKVQFDDMVRQFGDGDEERGAFLLMKLVTGMDIRSFDLEEKERATLYNRARRLEDLLVSRGVMREFSRSYIPKETKEEAIASQTPSFFSR